MIMSYIRLAWRNIKKYRLFSLINILGMAVGMAGFAIFALSAGIKINSDKFHSNADRIYSIVEVVVKEDSELVHKSFTPYPLLLATLYEFPEVSSGVRIQPAGRMVLNYGDNIFYENHVLYVDENFLEIFDFPLLLGNSNTVLSKPNSIILTENSAEKYFGSKNPIGQSITINNQMDLVVTGVLKNILRTSSIRFDFLIPIKNKYNSISSQTDWSNESLHTFILIEEKVNIESFNSKFPQLLDKYYPIQNDSYKNLYLFSLLDYRLKSEHIESFIDSSNPTAIYIILLIGIVLLAVVCINFINLSITRFLFRKKEIAIRKINGANRNQLIAQLILESMIMSFLALPLAFVLFEIIYPLFLNYVGAPSFDSFQSQAVFSIFSYPFIIIYMVVTSMFIGVVSGFYPAIVLSRYEPVTILRGGKSLGKRRHRGSKIMIVTQFTLSVLFIGFAEMIDQQYDHISNGNFGIERNNIASVSVNNLDDEQIKLFKNELNGLPEIQIISGSGQIPIFWFTEQQTVTMTGNEKIAFPINIYEVNYNFPEVLGIKIIRGTSFSKSASSDNNLIINRKLAEKLGWDDPIGKTLNLNNNKGIVTGVSEDFLFGDIGFEIPPSILHLSPYNQNILLIKYKPGIEFSTIQEIATSKWKQIIPGVPFEMINLEEYFLDTIQFVDRMNYLLRSIGFAAMFFSCMGLLGLTTFMIQRRIKEIGIRKVLGASIPRILWLIVSDYFTSILLAGVIGLSVLIISWNAILETGLLFFQQINPVTYLSILVIMITISTIAILMPILQTINTNPVDSLRYE